MVLNQNRPFAAIVSIDDLNRLEKLDIPDIPSAPRQPAFDPSFAPKQLADLDAAQGYTAIGQTLDEQTVALKLACHTLVMGAPGSGKSVTLSAAIAGARSADAPVEFAIATVGLVGPQLVHQLVDRAPSVVAVANDLTDGDRSLLTFINDVKDQISRRRSLLKEQGASTIEEYRNRAPADQTPMNDLIIIVEGRSRLANHNGRPLDRIMSKVLTDGAALGIYLWYFDAEAPEPDGLLPEQPGFLDDCADTFAQRIAHRTDASASRLVVGSDEASLISTAGEGLLRTAGSGAAVRFRVAAPDTEATIITAPPVKLPGGAGKDFWKTMVVGGR
ncbi:putative ESX-4 secretion system protein [Mycolicibacterium gilvum]|uniref:Putative ESX-4 secretion system protein n=1 Tax=Mycolicibacterium gilvum TaxID=1804 RepID=A0A378SLB5_9MYCO|nr:hypothetical protein [Mycolicibacterium gilvum]STZ43125.1 putative ESX-4 secretion system protein [Mycolicibacterium gilvum]